MNKYYVYVLEDKQTHEIWWNDMARYSIKDLKKVLRKYQNSMIWDTMKRRAICSMLVPTMKPLD